MTDTPTMADMADVDTRVHTQLRMPAVRLRRGGRTLYQLALKADHFGQIVPTVPGHVVQSTQRGFHESHAKKIARFIINNPDTWAFGPVSLALKSQYMGFERYKGIGENSVEYGVLTLEPGATESMLILDGQHRRAALQIIRNKQLGRLSDELYKAALRGIDNSDLSVDLYEIDELADVRRVFNWMNTTKTVTTAERVLLDNTNPFNEAVQRITGSLTGRYESDRIAWLAKLCIPLMDNEFRRVAQRVTGASTYWLSATNLRAILMARTTASQRLTAADRKAVSPTRVVESAKRLFNSELPELRPEWKMLRASEVNGMQLPGLRQTNLAFDPMIALAGAWSLSLLHGLPDGADHLDDLAAEWRGLGLSVDDPSMLLVLDNREEPVRPTMQARFAKGSAQNILDAARAA